MVFGDFNEFVGNYEKHGGQPQPIHLMRNSQQALEEYGLTDMVYMEYPFTWEKGGLRLECLIGS